MPLGYKRNLVYVKIYHISMTGTSHDENYQSQRGKGKCVLTAFVPPKR